MAGESVFIGAWALDNLGRIGKITEFRPSGLPQDERGSGTFFGFTLDDNVWRCKRPKLLDPKDSAKLDQLYDFCVNYDPMS